MLFFYKQVFKKGSMILAFINITSMTFAQGVHQINIKPEKNQQKISVDVDGKPFTTFLYPDSMEKPVLYPIYASDGEIITRGFPLHPRAGDPVDHPHHVRLWFNYESVNGLDFWNNSY